MQKGHEALVSLANDHNVYILGAGFSADAGMPLLKEFLNRMRDSAPWLVISGYERESMAIARVLEFRLSSAGAAHRLNMNLENIEHLFSLSSASIGEELDDEISLAIAGTLLYCKHNARMHQVKLFAPPDWTAPAGWGDIDPSGQYNISRYDYVLGILTGALSGAKPPDASSFISLNYDNVFETFARRLGISYTYGFKGKAFRYEPGTYYSQANDFPVKLLKLHGSVSWALPGKRGEKMTPYDEYEAVSAKNLIPLLVPPSWQKQRHTRLVDVWQEAVRTIGLATRIIVIGFSLPETDPHFKYLLAAGLRSNISLRSVHFVNPDADSPGFRRRVAKLFPNNEHTRALVHFHSANLWQFATDSSYQRIMNRFPPEGVRIGS